MQIQCKVIIYRKMELNSLTGDSTLSKCVSDGWGTEQTVLAVEDSLLLILYLDGHPVSAAEGSQFSLR